MSIDHFKKEEVSPEILIPKKKETSTGKDFFIIAAGVLFVILTFFLYRAMTSLELKMALPSEGTMVIDTWGKPLDKTPKKLDPEEVQKFFQIGILCFAIGVLAFVVLFILLKWPQAVMRKLMEPAHGQNHSNRPRAPL